MKKSNLVYLFLIIIYVVCFFIQINQLPFERFPAYDTFWGNVLQAGKLNALKLSLQNFELPAINPYVNFSWNNSGDTTLSQSFLFPLNYLILIFPADAVIAIKMLMLLIIGGISTFLYMKLVTRNIFLSFLTALSYISLPFVISMNYYYPTLNTLCFVPLFLVLIHNILENENTKKILLFVMFSVLAISSGDVFVFIIFPVVIVVYSFFCSNGFYQYNIFNSFRKALKLVLLFFLSGSFYLIPLFTNIRSISVYKKYLEAAGFSLPTTSIGVKGFLKFFYDYGFPSLYKPIEGSGLLLYAPSFFYLVIIFSLIFRQLVFKKKPKQAIIPFALLMIGLFMFFVAFFYYSIPSLSKAGKGVLRYHLNIWPFMIVLAGFICLSSISQLSKRKIFGIIVPIILVTLALDIYLFVVPYPYKESYLFFVRHSLWTGTLHSSNLVPVRFLKDMWSVLPGVNALFLILFLLYTFSRKSYNNIKYIRAVFIFSTLILLLFSISIHNELRMQQNRWQIIFKDLYRWNSYLNRKECIDNFIDRYDKNYRTLYVCKNRLSSWILIAETELNIQEREKALFPYKETLHPYTGLLYSTLNGYIRLSNHHLTHSNKVPQSIALLKLMGVKYVISACEKIDDPFLIYREECLTKDSSFSYILGMLLGGSVYIYELKDPLGIAFLVGDYKKVNLTQILNTIWQNEEHPWTKNEVYLEEDPKTNIISNRDNPRNLSEVAEGSVEIEKEKFNEISLDIDTQSEKFLVLSYLYRPNWKAFLGSTEIQIFRAYGGFMCIKVPPGHYIVKLKYNPKDIYYGLFLTLLAFLIPLATHFIRLFIHKFKEN